MAQRAIHTIRVNFARGTYSKIYNGIVKGEDWVEYVVRARAGQTMIVRLQTDLDGSAFRVYPPGQGCSSDVNLPHLHDSNIDGKNYRGRLSASGDHRICVFNYEGELNTAHVKLGIGVTD
jgi:hypothetical protein